MNSITKKRIKAYFIDFVVSGLAVGTVEYLLRKKVKSEVVHILITPVVVPWSLECIQLKISGQTLGYKIMGLSLEGADTSDLTRKQIAKRMLYRQTVSPFKFLAHPIEFSKINGNALPHDHAANTFVREVE